MMGLLQQAQHGDAAGRAIAYIGSTALAATTQAARNLPISPQVADAAIVVCMVVLLGRLALDVAKWLDGRKRKK